MSSLRIAPGLALDADYVGGGTFALLAKKGAGKTYTGRVMAEEFWKAKVPFVALDPMDAWWGLRSSADGAGDGIPVAIFGGPHADAPLEETSGKLMADLVVDEGLSMILSLKHFGTRAAERRFALDFLERLYRRNSELVHLLIDEADLFAPQKPSPGDQPLLGVTENIVRRGRNNGIGCTLITQRPAVLNKDVLTQVDGLVAMRIVGLTDRQAIDEWVKGHGDLEQAAKVKGTLAGLANGECWWWIPELGILERVQIRRGRTFDSSPTRTRGDQRRDPKSFADIDMGAIEKKMAATIQRAKAQDPKELKRMAAELQKRLTAAEAELERLRDAKNATAAEVQEVVKEIEVPVFGKGEVEKLKDVAGELARVVGVVEGLASIAAELNQAAVSIERAVQSSADELVVKVREPRRATEAASPTPRRLAHRPEPRPRRNPDDGEFALTGPQQRILNALAALQTIGVDAADKTQLALFAEASPKSSSYSNNLGALRTAGLIAYPAPSLVALTTAGAAIADATAAPTTVDELHDYVRALVGPAKWRLLEQLIAVNDEPLAKEELAERAGTSVTSSSFSNNLGALRSLRLIDYPQPGFVAALPVLFMEGNGG